MVLLAILLPVGPAAAQDHDDDHHHHGDAAHDHAAEPTVDEEPEPEAAAPEPRSKPAPSAGQAGKAGKPAPGKGQKPRANKHLASAKEFAELLQEAILLEVKAQNYERKTLGAQELERLGGILLKRRQRIDADAVEFEDRLSAVSMVPLSMPVVPEDAELSTKERLALTSLSLAYESTRDVQGLKTYMASNQSFLSTIDWGDRDRAVRLRDTIVDRETTILLLAEQGRKILRGGQRATDVERMIVKLRRMAPDALARKSNVSSLILSDADVRRQVVREAVEFLRTPTVSTIPQEDSDTLVSKLPSLQIDLVEASHLSELREELTVIEVELTDVDARLADGGVNSLSPSERDEKTARWTALTNRQSTLQHQWMRTPPAQPELDELIRAQDNVIRRSMFELGYRGALFAYRYDAQRDRTEKSLETPYNTWQLLEEQASLINEMDEARPDPGPLDGLPPRLDPRYVKEQVALILALKKTRPDLFDRLPSPRKTTNIKVKSGTAAGTTPLGAKPPSSKKKSGGGRKKKKKKGRRY